jgi:hypothetical protein
VSSQSYTFKFQTARKNCTQRKINKEYYKLVSLSIVYDKKYITYYCSMTFQMAV